MTQLTITATQFRDLVAPVIPFADKGDGLPALTNILIRSQGDYVTALATDRYRLGLSRVKPKATPPSGLYALLSWRDARFITQLFKTRRGHSAPELTMTFDGDRVTVTQDAALGDFLQASVSFATPALDYPSMASIWPSADELRTDDAAKSIAVNPAFMADIKAAAPGETVQVIVRKGKPMIVLAGEDFVALVMPKSRQDTSEYAIHDYSGWSAIVAESTTPPVARKGKVA